MDRLAYHDLLVIMGRIYIIHMFVNYTVVIFIFSVPGFTHYRGAAFSKALQACNPKKIAPAGRAITGKNLQPENLRQLQGDPTPPSSHDPSIPCYTV
jgi:hypothetical protein